MKIAISYLGGAVQIARSATTSTRHLRSLVARPFRHGSLVFALVLLVASTAQLPAKESRDLEIVLTTQRVVIDAHGHEKFVDDVEGAPGDTIVYTAVYTNHSTQTMHRLMPTLPIPEGMEFVAASAIPAPAEASVDGRIFARVPLRATKKLPDGVEISVEIPPSGYRALRWHHGDLAPGKSIVVSARVRIAAAR